MESISSNKSILQMKKWVHRGRRNPPNLKVTKGLGRNPFLGFFWPTSPDTGRQNVSGHSHPRRARRALGGGGEVLARHHVPQALGHRERGPGFKAPTAGEPCGHGLPLPPPPSLQQGGRAHPSSEAGVCLKSGPSDHCKLLR